MCTRYVLMEEHYRAVLARLGIGAPPPFASRFNIAPGTAIPVVRTSAVMEQREAVGLQWGLIASWAKTKQDKIVNARAESVASKPSFREALRHRRCVIPASGFFEWETVNGRKLPWLFRRQGDAPFGFAGLWDRWQGPDGIAMETCALITTEPNELMRRIHSRMPVMLTGDDCAEWLAPTVTDPVKLAALLEPPPADEMTAVRVNARMNNPRVNDAECIVALPPGANDEPEEPQLSLGL